MNSGLVLCVVTAVGFGSWPLISRASGASGAWVSTTVMLVTLIVGAAAQMSKFGSLPPTKAILLLVLAGTANGIAMVTYGRLVSGTEFEMSGLATAALVMMIAVISIGGIVFFDETLNAQKIAGILFAGLAAWLLTK